MAAFSRQGNAGAGRWPNTRVAPRTLRTLAAAGALGVLLVATPLTQTTDKSVLASRVVRLTRDADWKLTRTVPVRFRTHHPQGLVKIGDTFLVSAVEVTARTNRLPRPVGGYDRDTGEGIGHLFKMDAEGNLLSAVKVGEGTIYHPGGIDYDGTSVWVPVAEYRPNSRSIVYRVDPATMKATEVFRFADHIGAIVHDTDEDTLHGVSWGSRRFYRWPLGPEGRVTNPDASPATLRTLNPSHYVDYQDCKYAGARQMLCSGLAELRPAAGAPPFRLGGLDLIDLGDGRPKHQVPVPLWTSGGLAMTRNPTWIEPTATGLRAFFMPEDEASRVYVYEVEL